MTRLSSSSSGFCGRLEVVSPFELGQFILLGRKTGALHLTSGEQKGVLYALDGRIVSVIGPDLRGGLEIAKKLLSWSEGEFEFIDEPVAPSEEIEMGTETLLLETARQMDESGIEVEQVAASLETADELSKSFAALTLSGGAGLSGQDGSPLAWISQAPGRSLIHMPDYKLSGVDAKGKTVTFESNETPDPGRILSKPINEVPWNGWITVEGKRFYLSSGEAGYRLVHPFPRPKLEMHLSDNTVLDKLFRTQSAAAIYGPPDSGRSLLTALFISRQVALGSRVVYLTGLPVQDLGDGKRILHVIQPPGETLAAGYDAISRWQPDWVAIDLDPSPDLPGFVQACRATGIPLTLTLQAPLREWALESIRLLTGGETSGWELIAPKTKGIQPTIDLVFDAA